MVGLSHFGLVGKVGGEPGRVGPALVHGVGPSEKERDRVAATQPNPNKHTVTGQDEGGVETASQPHSVSGLCSPATDN